MQITRQADYAIRAILYLSALNPTDRAATSLIAEKQEIPPSFSGKDHFPAFHSRINSYITWSKRWCHPGKRPRCHFPFGRC